MRMNQATAVILSRDQLEQVLRRILGQDRALPEDWEAEATTYDLPRFHNEEEFLDRFQQAGEQMLAEEIQDPLRLKALLAACGHPYDYARLGHPFSTLYELYLRARTGAERAVAFASRTKAFLAPIEAPGRTGPVRLYAAGRLDPEATAALRAQQQVEAHENWTDPLPARIPGTLTLYVSEKPPEDVALETIQADAVSCPVDEGGVLLIRQGANLDPKGIQLIRKRTVAALLAANAKTELQRLVGLPVPPAPRAVTAADCDELLRKIFPQMRASAYFCTGLAAEAAVFSATAEALAAEAGAPVRLFYAENAYGGTVQLIAEILSREGRIMPVPLPVRGRSSQGEEVTLVDRVIASLPALEGPAFLFLENPTNPELQEHDFPRLMEELKGHQARTGRQIPVLVDTTLAPLYPLFDQDFARDWPFLIVKSGSKYLTKGKATLGVVLGADNALAQEILEKARKHGEAADSFAKASQLRALGQGLEDLAPRMERIAAHTCHLADGIREQLRLRGHDDVILYSMTDDQVKAGMASGVLSFYLPPAPTEHPDLVDEFVEYLLTHAPELVKNRVSYGQSTGEGRPDYFYVINPEESTQGALSKDVKAAQKKGGVQICRISVPENADVEGLLRAMGGFFDKKYR